MTSNLVGIVKLWVCVFFIAGQIGCQNASNLFGNPVVRYGSLPSPGPTAAVAVEQQSQVPRKSLARRRELRGVWITNVDSEVLATRANIAFAMQRLANLNFTTAYTVVYNSEKTLFPSSTMQRYVGYAMDSAPQYLNRNPLQEAIEEGLKNDISVVPWFEWGLKVPSKGVLARQNPSWLAENRSGAKTKETGGLQLSWLNILMPEVQNYFVALVSEVVEKYKVSQVQFDDNFAIPADFLQDAELVRRYVTSTGLTPPSSEKQRGWDNWVQWRSKLVTEAVLKIFSQLKNKYPGLRISISPNPQVWAVANYMQDWKAWLDSGLVDTIVLQVYRDDLQLLRNELNSPTLAGIKSKVAIGLLAGLRAKPVQINNLRLQAQVVRDLGFAGVSFFFYDSLFRIAPSGETTSAREATMRVIFSDTSKEPAGF